MTDYKQYILCHICIYDYTNFSHIVQCVIIITEASGVKCAMALFY